jgi:hypothetical protein
LPHATTGKLLKTKLREELAAASCPRPERPALSPEFCVGSARAGPPRSPFLEAGGTSMSKAALTMSSAC